MNKIQRNADVVLGNNDLEPLHCFKEFPVFMGCVEHDISEDVVSDMSWYISKASGMIQLNPLLPLDVVYSNEHGSGTIGKAWDDHHQSFSEFINSYVGRSVLEIGGLHGILAKKCLTTKDLDWTMIEPNPIVHKDIPITVIRGFFDSNFYSEKEYDTIIHSHVLEHVYDPDDFMRCSSNFLGVGGKLIFSLPNMQQMLKNNYTNCVNFEHTVYFIEPYIEFFLAKYGFKLIEKQYYKTDHSIFYSAIKVDSIENIKLSGSLYQENKNIFKNYITSHLEDVKKINAYLVDVDAPVYLFGAHVFSQYLLAFGLNSNTITCILDNDLNKENKRLYGTNLTVKSPKILKNISKAFVILRAGVYNDEIKEDILENINGNIVFI